MPVDSLERLVPEQLESHEVTGQLTLQLHLERYQFAAAQVRPGRILDIACGVGYGTEILFQGNRQNTEAIGVDCSKDSIKYATERYAQLGIRFTYADAMSFQDAHGFDTIVSLETIEHVPDPAGLITHLLQLLRPGGMFIGSVPTTPTVDANPHHLHDFTPQSFRNMFSTHGLQEVTSLQQVQPFNPITVLARKEKRLADLRPNLGSYYVTHPHAFFQRCWSTLRHGFANHYLTSVWCKPHA
ncbi:MAG: class I SAM-dependent methyltransferase [Nitrospirales bacterium]